METTVERLEAMKLQSDYNLIKHVNTSVQIMKGEVLNPTIRSKHSELSTQLKEISAAQSESMKNIRSSLNSVSELIQNLTLYYSTKEPHKASTTLYTLQYNTSVL
uniref:Uncharacterized protein n=1 Tax=Labrus bergylta TaxID=56723 RepID=A0A3Q3EJC6_9LABR